MTKFGWYVHGDTSPIAQKIMQRISDTKHPDLLSSVILTDKGLNFCSNLIKEASNPIPPDIILSHLKNDLNEETNSLWGGEGQISPKWEPNFLLNYLIAPQLSGSSHGLSIGLIHDDEEKHLFTRYELQSKYGRISGSGSLQKSIQTGSDYLGRTKYQYILSLRFKGNIEIPLTFGSFALLSSFQDLKNVFIDKYGHADITVSENGRSNGQMSFDGYSLGWSREDQTLPNELKEFDKCINFKVRYNIPLSNPGAAPTIIVSLISKKDINLEVVCTSTDPAYLDAPPAKLCLKAGVKNQAKFEPGKVTTHNAIMEEKPKVNKSLETFVIDGGYSRMCSSKPTYITPSQFQLIGIKNGGGIFHEITTCGVNPVTEKFQIAVGFAKLTGTEYKLGENYWPIAGFEKEPSDAPYIRNIVHASIDHESEIIDGKLTLIQVATAQINVISSDTKTFNITVLIRAFENPNGGPPKLYVQIYNYADDIDGYLDIASNIPYKFFKDGPIRIHIEKGQRFTFEGLE